MKRIAITLLVTLVAITTSIAQAPEGVNYQAVARDGNGTALKNESIDVRFTIREGNPGGSIMYDETHSSSTNDFGLFTLVVGSGTPNTGQFSDVDWGSNSYFLQVEIDAGNGFVDLGTTQMMSVPYALYAKEAGNGGKDYVAGNGIDITNETITNTGDLDASDDLLKGDAAGGDLTGTYPAPTVSKIQGMPVSAQIPNVGDVLLWNGSAWVPDTVSSQGGGSSLWLKNGNDVYYNQGMVGVNNPNPDQHLDVEGTFQLSNTGTSYNQSTDNADESYSLTIDGDTIHSFYVNKRRYASLFGDNAPVTGVSAFDVNTHTGTNSYGGMYVNHESATGKPFYGYAAGGTSKAWTYWDPNTEQFRVNNSGDHLVVNKNGNVGIGTTNPQAPLQVEGEFRLSNNNELFEIQVNGDGQMEIQPNAIGNPAITIDDDKNYVGLYGATPITINSAFDINTAATGTNYGGMFVNTIDTSGKPFYGYGAAGKAEAWTYYDGTTGNWQLYNGGNHMTVTNDGRVGIGTTNPEFAKTKVYYNGSTWIPNIMEIEVGPNANYERLMRLTVPGGTTTGNYITMTNGILVTARINTKGEGYFNNLEIQEANEEPNPGELYRNALPLAFASVYSNGSLANKTKYNIASSNKTGTGTYVFTLHHRWRYEPVVMITCYDATGGEMGTYQFDSNAETITVKITDDNGNLVDSNFSLLVFGEVKNF